MLMGVVTTWARAVLGIIADVPVDVLNTMWTRVCR
jgi:hypothetical protein